LLIEGRFPEKRKLGSLAARLAQPGRPVRTHYSATPLLHLSTNDAGFLKAEIAAPARSGQTDDDVIYQMELQNPAAFVDPTG
jgi:hypothetical protein